MEDTTDTDFRGSTPPLKRPRLESFDNDDMSVEVFDFSSDEEDENPKHSQLNPCNQSFDMKRVVSSIEQGEAVLDRVDGRDVVLVVGKTGTGKVKYPNSA